MAFLQAINSKCTISCRENYLIVMYAPEVVVIWFFNVSNWSVVGIISLPLAFLQLCAYKFCFFVENNVFKELYCSRKLCFTSYSFNRITAPFTRLYMSSDRFVLAVESLDLSQTDKSIIWVSSFPKLSGDLLFLSQKLRPELSAKRCS